MKTFKNCLLGFGILVSLFIIYAHTLHPILFFSRQAISYTDSFALKGGKEVFFTSGDRTLRGHLKLPENPVGKVPAIVFCDGSGGASSYATTYYSKFLDSLFEQNLPKDSFAYFYFEKRGVGKSEGKWYDTDFEQRAEDVKAAADFLKSIPGIDSHKLIVVGHSQGGWMVQVCLAKYPQTFSAGISMAGPTFGVKGQIINDYATSYYCKEGIQETEAKRKATQQVNFAFFLTALFPLKQEWRQLSVIMKFEPAPYLVTINKPLLLLFNENDALVSPETCLLRLKQLFPTGIPANMKTIVLKGTNHGFRLSDVCYAGAYKDVPFSDECKKVLREWFMKYGY